MKKFLIAIFLLAIMFLSMTSIFSTVKANTNLARLYGYVEPGTDQQEINDESAVCSTISWCFSSDAFSACIPTDYYGANTNFYNVYWNLYHQWDGTGYADYVTNWWVGDYFPSGGGWPYGPGPFGHIGLYGQGADSNNLSNFIWDEFIYDGATNAGSDFGPQPSVQYFDFIWACSCGGLYWNNNGGWNPADGLEGPNAYIYSSTEPAYLPVNTNTQYGTFDSDGDATGMPFAWTGTLAMSTNGYWSSSGNYCYIGWVGTSPHMGDVLYGTSVSVNTFPELFYEVAVGLFSENSHPTFGQCLDAATMGTYGTWYVDSPLYNGYWVNAQCGNDPQFDWSYTALQILGNSYNCIPY